MIYFCNCCIYEVFIFTILDEKFYNFKSIKDIHTYIGELITVRLLEMLPAKYIYDLSSSV